MAAPTHHEGDYAAGILGLFPPGDAWPRDPAGRLARLARCIAPTYARSHARLNGLLVDAFPRTSVELLTEWEGTTGLPDACSGPADSIAARQAQVVAKLVGRGGQSIPYFTAVAAALGYTITIQQFAPARADVTCADDPCYEPEWAFVWRVHAPTATVAYAQADDAYADDPLLTTGNAVLECTLGRLGPAHLVLQFQYEG